MDAAATKVVTSQRFFIPAFSHWGQRFSMLSVSV
jgi:hypothetical protein